MLEEELQTSFLDYAMSVIIDRAIPDARDGLKPVQRRILYAMHKIGNTHDRPTKKSATVVGEVIGHYHPHGDIPIYDALVRMAQTFAMNHTLVEGQGNFGCFTKETKIKLTDGRDVDFEHLIKEQAEGKRHWTFAFNSATNLVEVAEIRNPRLTRKNAELVQVTLDNGATLRCTPDHKFLLRNGAYSQAKDLKAEDSLMPVYTKPFDGTTDKNLKDYETVLQPVTNEWQFIHHLSDSWNLKEGAYLRTDGRVRHHIDINKKNNDPDNIKRMSWKEHWKLHYELASWRHKNDPEYVKKLAKGRMKYIQENRNHLSRRMAERNKENWQIPSYRKMHIDSIKKRWENQAYREERVAISSRTLKKTWKSEQFRALMSESKSKQMKKLWKSDSYRSKMREVTRNMSLKLWSDPKHRERMSERMKEIAKDPELLKMRGQKAKALWADPEYRAKFPSDYFRSIGKMSRISEKNRLMHSQKAKRQWTDPSFRSRMTERVRASDKKRLLDDPEAMKKLAQSAKQSLYVKWQDPSYKKRVIRSKILRYVSELLKESEEVSPEAYESGRKNNWVPRLDNVLKYFSSFDEMVQAAKTYNHKVASIIFLEEREDTYDLTIDNLHNFALSAGVFVHNSIDGDPPAAMRYTEVRLAKISDEILADLDKETVNFLPNFDNTEKEPEILPTRLPNLLINGAAGIAVGVATSIPPHNLSEVCDALLHMLDHKDATPEEIMELVKGPDFPTGGIAIVSQNSLNGYKYGRGQLTVRGKVGIDEKEGRITITEIPYNVNKAAFVENIANLARDRRIVGIRDIRDESDRNGISIVIDLTRDANAEQILNQLYRHTQLETTFPLISLAVTGKVLKSFSITQLLNTFLNYRREIVTKRSQYELKVAKDRLHIVQGLQVAVAQIDSVVKTIKDCKEVSEARQMLMAHYSLSEKQANAILDMKLSRLTLLESKTLDKEAEELNVRILHYTEVLADPAKVDGIIKKETVELKAKYGRPRKTEIIHMDQELEIQDEDLLSDERVSVILTNSGYVKKMSVTSYKDQERGGKGIIAMNLKEGDFVKHMIAPRNKDYVLFLSNLGRLYWLKAYNIPEGSRYSEGRSIANLLNLQNESIVTMFRIKNFETSSVVFLTARGQVKRTSANLFSRPRASGVRAISLNNGDEIADAIVVRDQKYIVVATKNGKSIRFGVEDVRQMGRTAAGVRGIRLHEGDVAKNLIAAGEEGSLLTVSEKGYGKITSIEEYRMQGRGGGGVLNLKVNEKTGPVAKALFLNKEQKLLLINSKGVSIMIPISSIRITGRAASGVRLMKVEPGAKVIDARLMDDAVPEVDSNVGN